MRIRKIARWVVIASLVFAGSGSAADGIKVAENVTPAPASLSAVDSLAPKIMPREAWKAKAALPGMKPQQIKGIILHNTAIKRSPSRALEVKMRNLQSFSQSAAQVTPTYKKPPWPDVPYHFYVDANGRTAEGRDVAFAGDTNTKYNTSGYIQVVVEGDFEQEEPTAEQLAAVRMVLVWLSLRWNVPVEAITVHKNHASTSCPGRHFMAALPNLMRETAASRTAVIQRLCSAPMPAGSSPAFCKG
jgi:hypothetical protein